MKVCEDGEFCSMKDLDIGRIWKRMIPYISVVELTNFILRFVFKNSNSIRVYCVGKHNYPCDRSNVHDDNRHSDDDADDDVLGLCSDTYKECSTECPNMMLDDQMLYDNSNNSRNGMCED